MQAGIEQDTYQERNKMWVLNIGARIITDYCTLHFKVGKLPPTRSERPPIKQWPMIILSLENLEGVQVCATCCHLSNLSIFLVPVLFLHSLSVRPYFVFLSILQYIFEILCCSYHLSESSGVFHGQLEILSFILSRITWMTKLVDLISTFSLPYKWRSNHPPRHL